MPFSRLSQIIRQQNDRSVKIPNFSNPFFYLDDVVVFLQHTQRCSMGIKGENADHRAGFAAWTGIDMQIQL